MAARKVTLRPTVAADLAIAGDSPLPHRIRAITAEIDGRVIGVGGIGYRPDGVVFGFVHALPEAKNYPLAFHRAGRMAMAMVEQLKLPCVIAEPQANNPAAEPWLKRLGFVRTVIADHAVYVWTRKQIA